MQKLTRICQMIVALLTLSIVFSMLYIIRTTIDYMHQLRILYMLHYPVMHSLSKRERERVAVNMQGTVFTLA